MYNVCVQICSKIAGKWIITVQYSTVQVHDMMAEGLMAILITLVVLSSVRLDINHTILLHTCMALFCA